MADIDLKISVLKKSMSTFSGWLDQCEELINALPTQLEQCDHAHLRELAMKYKDLLLQMKERCDYMTEVNNLCKEIGETTAPKPHPSSPTPPDPSPDDKPAATLNSSTSSPPPSPTLNPRLAQLATEVKDLNTRFATTCVQARQHYATLSKTMANALQQPSRPASLYSFSFSLSSPTPDRKEFLLSGSSLDGEAPGNHDHSSSRHSGHHRHHKKSKGHKAKKRDRLSLSLDPRNEDDKESSSSSYQHPLSKSTRPRIQSMNLSNTFSSSSPSPPEETDAETSVSLKGLGLSTSAGVTDLDGFIWGGGGNTLDSCSASAASVDKTSPSSAAATYIPTHPPPPTASSSSSAVANAKRAVFIRANSETGAEVQTTSDSVGAAVLRRRVSLPEADTDLARRRRIRSCSGALQFVQEIGLVQIQEEGTRGLRPRSAVLLSDSEQDLSAAVQAALSSGSGQKALLSKAMKRRSMELNERVRSSSSMQTLHTLSETDQVSGTPAGKGVNSPLLVSTKTGGSLCDLPARTRFSFTSFDSLDPRPILGGGDLTSELSRIASSERTGSFEALNSSRVLPRKGNYTANSNIINGDSSVVFKAPPGALLTPGRLDPRKSRSMDVLSPTGPPPKVSLTMKLGELSNQLQEFVHSIAEGKHCPLQSLALELKLGEIKAMLTILEVQDLELLRLRALYSPDDQQRLEARERERKGRLSPTWKDHHAAVSYSVSEVKGKKEEIDKLTQRIGLLRNHCEESIQQMEEVLEFVTQFEGEMKMLRDFLTSHTSQLAAMRKKKEESFSEETWTQLQLALTEINDHKGKLQSIQELSTHLLYLEPIFDGRPVSDDLRTLSNHFQNLVMEVFSLLEAQAKQRADQLLLEVSVLSSWVTETELAVQALAKKTKKQSSIASKLIATKESLDEDLRKKQESLLTITEKIQPLTAVLSPDDSATLRDLISQVDSHTKSLLQLENSLQVVELDLKEHDPSRGAAKMAGNKMDNKLDASLVGEGRLQNSGRYQIGGPIKLQNGARNHSGGNSKSSKFDDDDTDGNYAEIDALREQILKSGGSKVPAPSLVASGQKKSNSSGQDSNARGAPQSNGPAGPVGGTVMNGMSRLSPRSAQAGGSGLGPGPAAPPALYERVEEIIPSPFADYDLVPSRTLDTAIEQLPRQLGPKVVLSQTPSHYDSPVTSSHYQSPRSSQSHSPSPSLTTPTPQYYQVPTSLLRQSQHHHSLSTPSPLPTPPPSASGPGPSPCASQASPTHSQVKKNRYVEIDVFPDSNYSSPRSLVIKKSSSAGSVSRLEGAQPISQRRAGGDRPDSSEGEAKPEKPPRNQYHGRGEREGGSGGGDSGGEGRGRRKKKRRSERGSSLHEELLEFISQEWAALEIAELSTTSSAEEEAKLDEAISCLESYEQRSSCVKFVNGLRDLETSIKGAKEQISLIRTPRVPDLEQVHGYIDQCQKLNDRISTLYPRLEAYNEESLQLVSSLGRAPSCSKVAQLLEIRLFDVSTLWHSANLKVATCTRELRQREGEINTLYRQLRTISRALDEARGLLDKKQSVLCVDEYLSQCKEMQSKLGSLSEVRVQVTSNIKGSVLHSPQLPVCQNLLDQLKQVDGQWVNIFKELSDVPQLEPILIKKMFINISGEFSSTENMLKELVKQRALKLADAQENCKVCQDHLQKLNKFKSTLNKTDARLVTIIETSSLNSQDSSDDGMELSGVRRSGSGTGRSQLTNGVVENENGTGIQVEMVITQYGPELASVNHKEMLKFCKALLQRTEELFSEVEELSSKLQSESDLLGRFYKELEELQVWTSDTKSMLGSGSHSNGMATSAQPLTSVAQLRGKHQAICQQVATRQPKMDSIQSLAAEVLKLPSAQAEKQTVKKQLTELYNDWDDICQQCVPAGALPKVATPTGPGGSLAQFLSTPDFEDETQMIEWLILVESRIQPQQMTVGDFRQLRRQQREIQMIETELKSREKDYQHFMKGFRDSTLSISQASDIVDPESSATAAASSLRLTTAESLAAKMVKFSDENTLERFQRHQDIGNGINFSDSGSKSSESDFNASLPDSVKDAIPMLVVDGAASISNGGGGGVVVGGAVGGAGGRPHFLRSSSGRYHYMGPESNLRNGLHHHTSAPTIGIAAGGSSQPSLGGGGGAPDSPVPDDVYQLAILWKGLWSGLVQQKKRLEAIQEAWKAFEDKKEVFVNFLAKAEERVQSVFKVLSTTKDLAVMNAEFGAYQSFSNEVQSHSQCLTSLNDMSRDLINDHHSNDDTHDLQDTMDDLNLRWKKMMQSYTQHQPTVTALHTRWLEFFRDYQSFLQWLKTMDLDMSNLNPFVKDMDAVKTQLEKLKEIQQELHAKEGVIESIRLHAHKLLQGLGGNHVNSAAIHARLDNMGRRWDHLQTLAMDRKTALEQALSEKQDFLSRLADVLAWLNQAEKHLAGQKPLGTDYYTVHSQYQAQQGFWLEMTEQRSKVDAVIKSGRQVAMETHWPQGTGESLRSQYGGLEERWRKLWSEGEQWGQLLQTVHPELEKFQTLCTECGQKLSDAELKMVKQEPVAKKMAILEQQYEALQQFENALLAIGDILEALVMSQKRQLQLSVKVSPDLIQLVKRFHQRWNELKQKVESRHSAIDKAMVKYDPVNLGVAELPYGWQRSTTENGTPYYINTRVHNSAQWHHPELSELYSRLKTEHTLSSYPSSVYPIALKLRAIQKRTQLNLLKTQHALSIYSDHFTKLHGNSLLDHPIPPYDATCLAVDMFQKVEDADSAQSGSAAMATAQPIDFYLNSAVELSTCFLRDVFDVSHTGSINCLSYHIGVICMSAGKLDEKYKALFTLISNGQSGIDTNQLTQFLEQVVQIPQSVCETQFCTLHAIDVCVRECFRKYVGVGKLQMPQFVSWLQTEPPPLSWLPILHRLAAAEKAHHPVKCSLCKTYPITGFRYRCVQCSGFDMCQTCYWSGKTGKSHDRSKHFMEEYCIPQKTGDNVFKTLQRSFRHKRSKSGGGGVTAAAAAAAAASSSSTSQSNKKQPPSQQTQHQKQLHQQTTTTTAAATTAGGQRSNVTPNATPAAKVGGDSHHRLGPPTIQKTVTASPSTGVRHSAYVALTIGESPSLPPTINTTVDSEAHPGRRFTVTEDMKTAWQRGGAGGGGANPRPKVESTPPPVPMPSRSSSANDTTAVHQPRTSTPLKGRQLHNLHRTPAHVRGSGNMDASLSQLTEKNRNLSKRLSSLRDRRSSMSASGDGSSSLTRNQGQQKDGSHHPPSGSSLPSAAAASTTEEPLSVEEQLRKRNAYLQGRVDVLQQQNRQLGQCVHELRSFTDMQRQQQFARVHPRNQTPNPYLLPVQNGGPPSVTSGHQAYRHHGNVYATPHPTATTNSSSISSHNAPNQSTVRPLTTNHQLSLHHPHHHGNTVPPPHHFTSQHNLHNPHNPHQAHRPHPHPHQPLHHQTHNVSTGGSAGVNYGRTSPVPPPSKFIQPAAATVSRRSTSPVPHQLAPTSAAGGGGAGGGASYSRPRPGSRTPPPVPGRVSPNSQSRGPGHMQGRPQTQL